MSQSRGWVGIDLDGTLAHYDHWRGAGHVGAPIARMVERVQAWLDEGMDVRIFTARVYVPSERIANIELYKLRQREAQESHEAIDKFCLEQFGRTLPVTCTKDFSMIQLWDDRAIQVVQNTGLTVREALGIAENVS